MTLQCDPGYVSDVDVLTCEGTLMWSPDPGTVVCRPLTPPPPTTRECTVNNITFHTTVVCFCGASPVNCNRRLVSSMAINTCYIH